MNIISQNYELWVSSYCKEDLNALGPDDEPDPDMITVHRVIGWFAHLDRDYNGFPRDAVTPLTPTGRLGNDRTICSFQKKWADAHNDAWSHISKVLAVRETNQVGDNT